MAKGLHKIKSDNGIHALIKDNEAVVRRTKAIHKRAVEKSKFCKRFLSDNGYDETAYNYGNGVGARACPWTIKRKRASIERFIDSILNKTGREFTDTGTIFVALPIMFNSMQSANKFFKSTDCDSLLETIRAGLIKFMGSKQVGLHGKGKIVQEVGEINWVSSLDCYPYYDSASVDIVKTGKKKTFTVREDSIAKVWFLHLHIWTAYDKQYAIQQLRKFHSWVVNNAIMTKVHKKYSSQQQGLRAGKVRWSACTYSIAQLSAYFVKAHFRVVNKADPTHFNYNKYRWAMKDRDMRLWVTGFGAVPMTKMVMLSSQASDTVQFNKPIKVAQ